MGSGQPPDARNEHSGDLGLAASSGGRRVSVPERGKEGIAGVLAHDGLSWLGSSSSERSNNNGMEVGSSPDRAAFPRPTDRSRSRFRRIHTRLGRVTWVLMTPIWLVGLILLFNSARRGIADHFMTHLLNLEAVARSSSDRDRPLIEKIFRAARLKRRRRSVREIVKSCG